MAMLDSLANKYMYIMLRGIFHLKFTRTSLESS